MKLVQASLGVRKGAEHRFQLCGGRGNLVHANLGVHREIKGSFHYSEGLVKLCNGIFSARKDLQCSLKH